MGWFVDDGEKPATFLRRSEGRDWHKADLRGALANVCFRGKSRHRNEGGLT